MHARYAATTLAGILAASVALGAATAPVSAASPRRADPDACKLEATTSWVSEGHTTDYDIFLRPEGTLRAVMLFLDFPNARASNAPEGYTTTDAYVDWLRPAEEWFERSSFGRLDLDITPVDRWYRMSRDDEAYGFQRGISFATQMDYVREAVALADGDVDFSAYDLVYLVATRNASAITFSPAFIDAADSAVLADGVAVAHGATFGQDIWGWGETGFQVLNHETGHTFGLADLYAFDPSTWDYQPYTAGWSVMSLINGPAPDLFAWEKWKLGWISDRQVACVTAGTAKVRLSAIEVDTRGTKLLVVPTGLHTAYLIETRRASGNDVDACSTGVLVSYLDTSIPTGYGPIRVQDATPGDDATADCRDLDVATFGAGTRPSQFTSDDGRVQVTVLRQSRLVDTVRVVVAP